MPRARSGTLVPPGADGFWRARVTKDHADGRKTRPLYSLGTTDKSLARRKLARLNTLIASGRDPLDAAEAVNAPERVKDYAEAWGSKRVAQGIAKAPSERGILRLHALDAIGDLPVCDVTPTHIRGILDDVVAKGLMRGTVEQVRGVLSRLFDDAWRAEIIEANPVARVKLPAMREARKERVILSDDEFSLFVASPAVDLELRMLSLVARCEGGMRTGDLHKWDWTMIDRVQFAECIIPRSKTSKPQALAIPDVLAPFLRAWWERAGKPESGPVFPARIGKRAGQAKRPSNSYADRLRRDLFRARVYRMAPVEVPATTKGQRTDLGKAPDRTRLAPNPRDPLYFETSTTLPVDFHSFRRAFNTALAEAGVNVQHAMHLASHADAKVHSRYVMSTRAMRTVPSAALPRLPLGPLREASDRAGNVTVRDDWSRSPPLPSAQPRGFLVGAIGFEPTTPTVSRSRWALLEGTERYFSRGNRYWRVLRRPRRYRQVVRKVVRVGEAMRRLRRHGFCVPAPLFDLDPKSYRGGLVPEFGQQVERVVAHGGLRGHHQPEQPIGHGTHLLAVVLPSGHALRRDAHVASEVGTGPAEVFAQVANLGGRQAGSLTDDGEGDGPVQMLDLRDDHLMLAARLAATNLDPDERHIGQAGGRVAVVLSGRGHRFVALGALHGFILQAVTTRSSVSERNAMMTAMRAVRTR